MEHISTERRFDLDWLRVIATLILIPYHVARIFDFIPWYVKNPSRSIVLDLLLRFIELWHMPLFFFISGASTWYFLKKKPIHALMGKKVNQLLIPFVFGVVFLVPPVTYYTYLTIYPQIELNYFKYYPQFFKLNFAGIDGLKGSFTPLHLWFILFLMIFTFLSKGVFQYLLSKNGKDTCTRLYEKIEFSPLKLWLFALPFMFSRLLMPYPNLFYYFLFFIFGFIMVPDNKYQHLMGKINRLSVLMVIVLSSLYLVLRYKNISLDAVSFFGLIFQESLAGFIAWLWIIVILNFGQHFLKCSNRFLKYFNQAAYPVYLLHMSFIVPIGFYIIEYEMNLFLKYGLINLLSGFCTLLIYEFFVKQMKILRLLFGIR